MKILFQAVLSLAFAWMLYLATVYGMDGPRHIVYFISGFTAIMFLPLLFYVDKEDKRDERPYWFRVFLTVIDVGEILMLIWFGWWWCATAYSFGALASAAARFNEPDKKP